MTDDPSNHPVLLLPAGAPQKLLPAPSRPRSRRRWLLIPIGLLVLVAVYAFWPKSGASASNKNPSAKSDKGGKGGRGGAGPANVIATRARRGNINVYFSGLGSVTPINTVIVRSRVDGELMSVNYREGDLVHKGDLLLAIDPRPYQAALTQAEGQLLRDQAQLENARIDLARYQLLIKTKAIPEQQLATQAATVKQDEGIVKTDEGTVQNANLNVTYTKITAPITGRIGLRLVDPGNIVHASDQTGLLVITEVDPISVLFTINEDQIPTVVKKMRAGQKLAVDAFDREMKNKIASGTLITIDNQIDQTTGTVRLRSTFDNKSAALFPNQFVNARLLVDTHRNVVLLATAAIQRTSNSQYVYLVQPDSTVAVRTINIGVSEGEDSEITSGLNAGDAVVMTGADKLEEGTKVNPQIPGEQPPAGSTSNGGAANQKKGGRGKGGQGKQP
jgi:membrane fusion protein, multidrug efflux system